MSEAGDGLEAATKELSAVMAGFMPPTPTWRGVDAAFLWELLLGDSDAERHARLTELIGCAAEMAGAQEECARHAEQVERLRIELDQARASNRTKENR